MFEVKQRIDLGEAFAQLPLDKQKLFLMYKLWDLQDVDASDVIHDSLKVMHESLQVQLAIDIIRYLSKDRCKQIVEFLKEKGTL